MVARGRATAHFTWQELGHPPPARRARALQLARQLEVLRSQLGGKPIRIVSGYRSRSTNARVGGAERSQHLVAAAADLPRGTATIAQAERAGFRGIGYSGGWAIHVDVREGPSARWSYD